MRIAINCINQSRFIRGVDRYNIELIRHLSRIDHYNHYYIVCGAWQNDLLQTTDNPNFHFIKIKWLSQCFLRNIFSGVLFPVIASRYRADIVHIPNTMPHAIKRARTVITVHDELLEFSNPDKYGAFRSWVRRQVIREETRKCDRIIAVSSSVKNVLQERLGIPAHKINVIYNGVNTAQFSPVHKGRFPTAVSKPYILFVSVIDRNKNVECLINAFRRLKPALQDSYQVVIAGSPGNAYRDMLRLVHILHLDHKVTILGQIREDLPFYYANASAFIMPSYHEGFCMPVVEALASRVPVLLSQNIAIASKVKDGAILFDPARPDDLTVKLESVLNDQAYATRLADKGYNVSKQFSWGLAAEAVLDLYRELNRTA